MTRFSKIQAYKGEWSDWQTPVDTILDGVTYKLACCDCGLVHDVEFRVATDQDRITLNVQFRMRRNVRSTAAMRANIKRIKDKLLNKDKQTCQ